MNNDSKYSNENNWQGTGMCRDALVDFIMEKKPWRGIKLLLLSVLTHLPLTIFCLMYFSAGVGRLVDTTIIHWFVLIFTACFEVFFYLKFENKADTVYLAFTNYIADFLDSRGSGYEFDFRNNDVLVYLTIIPSLIYFTIELIFQDFVHALPFLSVFIPFILKMVSNPIGSTGFLGAEAYYDEYFKKFTKLKLVKEDLIRSGLTTSPYLLILFLMMFWELSSTASTLDYIWIVWPAVGAMLAFSQIALSVHIQKSIAAFIVNQQEY